MGRRVVISGMGPFTSGAVGLEEFWSSIIGGKSGIKQIERFSTAGYTTTIAGECTDFKPTDYVEGKEARRMDRFQQFAVAGATLALEDAQFTITQDNAERTGVIVGSGIGGLGSMEEQHQILQEKGPRRVSPFVVPMIITDLAAGHISIIFGAKGPNVCTVSACASSSHAIGEAFETIKRDIADVMITGGAEASITPLGLAAFCAARALSTRNDEPTIASRPFDSERDGFVMSEGAGILIVEELEHALARGAKIYAEIIGYGATGDAYHITQPDPSGSGAIRAMRMALDEALIEPEEIDYINAHGTSTEVGDLAETRAIKSLFGMHAHNMLVSSTKSMTGHLLGAAGGVEIIACALAVDRGIVPPTINLDSPDAECDLNYVPNTAVYKDISVALSNSFGFGGHNACLIIKKYTQ